MRVSVALPTGNSLEYSVDKGCTLSDLRGVIRENEGIPEEMQNYMALSTAAQGDWESFPLSDLFPEDFDPNKEILELKLIVGPLDGGVGELDCCLCGCSCFHQGTCFAWLCGLGCGCVDDYSKISCQLCCFRGRCCTLL
mmetsp:Transcript_28168/g.43399  ORF Transcript_28168/g.43399 Transcript_28168/m.43399 type:complete len:139 (+) Transcript_28168:33-449(+)